MQELEKTTLIASLLKPLQSAGYKAVLMALNWRGCKSDVDLCKTKAVTIHKRIYFAQQGKQEGFGFKLQK